ncbi:hypothetical protein AMELA_G00099940 [Ameiurus melas]|uniref:phospholipase A2 n=1 Tax=Ameiurus melas TaxID=219545 RepID=A0A7J6ATD6_AMEME|nr:hypothetical protein AMELA_G00099940 [Ameiurus melas]
MWSVLFLFLSYLDGDFAKGEPSALEKESHVAHFLHNTTLCADTSGCHVGLSSQKAHDGKSKSGRQETEDRRYPASDTHTLRRSKRGLTYPGTLWCGAGNIADNYDQLGEFAETDECCRTHDHCPHVIHSFSSKYGFTNFKWHSISHCDCDDAMKRCLRAVNDTSSRVVGQAFFNVIEAPCFEISLEEQCVERHWYGVAEDIINKNNFVEDSQNFDWVSKKDNFMNNKFSSVGDFQYSNKMMRDEHQTTPVERQVSTTTAADAKQEAKMLRPQKQIKDMEFVQLFSTVSLTNTSKPTTAIPRQRVPKKKQRYRTPTFLPVKGTLHNMMTDNTTVSTTESTSLAGLAIHTPISLPGEEAPHNVESLREKGSAFNATAQNTPIVGTKRLRSRQKGGRRNSRKLYSLPSPTDPLTTEEPKVLPTDTTQGLTVEAFPETQSASQRLQYNGPKNTAKKPTTDRRVRSREHQSYDYSKYGVM